VKPVGVAGLGHFRVHFPDGHSEDVSLTSRAVVEAERRWPGLAADHSDRYRPNEGVHFMVWVSFGRPLDDFEKWLDEIAVVEPIGADEEDEPANPTRRAVGAVSSPTSPRRPASPNGTSKTSKQRAS
jgi:hypothetical protein